MPIPVPQLDDRDFEALVTEARLLIPRFAPTWTDHNLHDPGITLIELLAWLAEMQMYTLDQVTDQHLEKFLRLLGSPPKPATPAKALVIFGLPEGRIDPVLIRRGAQLIGRRDGTALDIPFETEQDLWAVPSRLLKIERLTPLGRVDLTDAYQRGPYLYAFGGEAGTAIAVGSQLLLGFSHPFPAAPAVHLDGTVSATQGSATVTGSGTAFTAQLTVGDIIRLDGQDRRVREIASDTSLVVDAPFAAAIPAGTPLAKLAELALAIRLYEADLPPLGAHGEEIPEVIPSAEVQWEYLAADGWHPLPHLTDETRALTTSGAIRSAGLGPDSPPAQQSDGLYWLRCRVARAGYEIPPRIAGIHLNAATAIEGRSVSRKIVAAGSGLPSQRIALGDAPIMAGSVALEVQETRDGAWQPWTAVADFDASRPEDRHVVLDLPQGVMAFGNGLHGRIVPKVTDDAGQAIPNIRATYRVGGGERGNLAVGEIQRIDMAGVVNITVANPEPASGGSEPESIEAAWRRVKADLAVPYRAVTSDDFEVLAKATPGLRVARAKAVPGFDPEDPAASRACLVTVVVVPYSFAHRPMPFDGFLKTVCRHLERHRLIGTELRVPRPVYVEVSVEAEVTVQAKSSPADVGQRVEQALEAFLDPLRGGGHQTGWPFGRPVFRSEVANVIERVEGVECLMELRLRAGDGALQTDGNIEIPKVALVCPGQLRIDAKESTPACEVKPCPSPAQP